MPRDSENTWNEANEISETRTEQAEKTEFRKDGTEERDGLSSGPKGPEGVSVYR
jgi:hypothetical protein